MNRDQLFTARWYLSTGKPVPNGGPLEALYELMAPVLGPMPGVTAPNPAPVPVPDPQPGTAQAKRARVALVVGHNSRATGAGSVPPLNLSEFAFNSKVTDALLVLARNTEIEMGRFFREFSPSGYASEIDACYRQVNAFKPDLVVELHFNGGGGNFIMMVVAKGSVLGTAAGAAMLHSMSEDLGIPIWTGGAPRGIDGRTRSDRGGRSVWAASCPVVLTEPFFGDHSQHAARIAEIGIDGMAAIYLKAIREALKALSHFDK